MTSPHLPEMQLTRHNNTDATTPDPTAGQLLKAARQAKGIQLSALSLMLKVPERQLEALEADDYETFMGGTTFLRAITLSMCRHLSIDAAPVMALLPSAVTTLPDARPALQRLPGLSSASFPPSRIDPRGLRSVLLLALLMLVITAAFVWLPSPEIWWTGLSSRQSANVVTEEMAVPLGQASNPESSEDAEQIPAAVDPALGTASVPSAAALPSLTPVHLRLESSAETWVEVRSTKGLKERHSLKAGESLEIQQPVPYSVAVGRAQAVKVTLRGQPFDLIPHTRQTVARFEVKE